MGNPQLENKSPFDAQVEEREHHLAQQAKIDQRQYEDHVEREFFEGVEAAELEFFEDVEASQTTNGEAQASVCFRLTPTPVTVQLANKK